MIDLTPLLQLRQELERKARDPKPLLRAVANRLRAAFRANFREGGRPPWKPLAPSTIRAKTVMGLPSQIRTPTGRKPRRLMQRSPLTGQMMLEATNILIRTGRLRDSVSQSYHPDHITRMDGWNLEVGTKVEYAMYHQHGTSPTVIRPKQAKVLAFIGNNGEMVFRREVHHPGLPARPFLTVTADDEADIADIIWSWLLKDEEVA